jgi:hypothetical protein
MKWVLMAIPASIFAWLGFTFYVYEDLDRYLPSFMHTSTAQMPFIGFIMSFCLTMGLSFLAINPRCLRSWGSVVLRSLIASVVSYVAFFIMQYFIVVLNISIFTQIFNAIPWVLSSFVIVICSTKFTRIVYSKRLVFLSVGIGVLSVIAWNIFYQMSELDYRVFLLFSVLFYFISMAVSVASEAPRSERYFLKVEGAVKTMDVALYKWLRTAPDKAVTIGKSVECSLQLSWDVQSNIAPVQAEIRLIRKVPYLIALEPGVILYGRPLRTNVRVRLHHGRSFSIGHTTFTYIEKDH